MDHQQLKTDIAQLLQKNKIMKEELEQKQKELDNFKEAAKTSMQRAKKSWREQALKFGRDQRELAIRDPDFTGQLKNILVASEHRLLKLELERDIAVALARSSRSSYIRLSDFDIEDCHLKIENSTAESIDLSGCSICFQLSGKRFVFSEGTELDQQSELSIWWGEQNRIRHAPDLNSIFWEFKDQFSRFESAQLFDMKNELFSRVQTNQACSIPELQLAHQGSRKRSFEEISTADEGGLESTKTLVDELTSGIPTIPHLTNRRAGPLVLDWAQMHEGRLRIRISNKGGDDLDISGFRLQSICYPSRTVQLPKNLKIKRGSMIDVKSPVATDHMEYKNHSNSPALQAEADASIELAGLTAFVQSGTFKISLLDPFDHQIAAIEEVNLISESHTTVRRVARRPDPGGQFNISQQIEAWFRGTVGRFFF